MSQLVSDLFKQKWNEQFKKNVTDKGFTAADVRAGGRATKAYPNKEDESWWMDNGPQFVQSWLQFRSESGWHIAMINNTPAIEIGLTPLFAGVPVQMHIDRVMYMPGEPGEPDGPNNYAIIDLKTGSQPPKSDLQLAFYAAGMEKVLGFRPRWGGYWMARTGQLGFLADLDQYPLEMIEDLIDQFKKARDSKVFLPNMGHCYMCSVSEFCKYRNPEKGSWKK